MGCSPSLQVLSNIQPSIEELRLLKNTKEDPNEAMIVDFVENSILIWLTDQPSRNTIPYTAKLRHVISTLKIFHNADTCYAFLSKIQEETIFLVVSGEHKQFISQSHQLSTVYKIYMFNVTTDAKVKKTSDQVLQVDSFRDINDLCNQLIEDRKLVEFDSLFIATSNPSTPESNSTKRNAMFLIVHLMKSVLSGYKFENDAKIEFAKFCRIQYANDVEQLQFIDDFEKNYRPQDALKWFAKTCFISRILNRVQRTMEFGLLYKIGFLMKHMIMLLIKFYDNMNSLSGNTTLVLYRGKTMTHNEFNSFNDHITGSFLTSPSFMVANTNKTLTIDLLTKLTSVYSQRIAVLFEIHIDPSTHTTTPFALLESVGFDAQSKYEEFCFTFGAVFRVESIEKSDEFSIVVWTVKLVLVDDSFSDLFHLLKPLRSDEVQTNAAAYLAKLLIDAGELDRAEKHFLGLLRDKSAFSQPRRRARIYVSIGNILLLKNDINKAIENYRQALAASLDVLQPNHPDLIPIYSAIGDCYSKNKNYALALENYEKAAEIIQLNIQSIDEEMVNSVNSRVGEMKIFLQGPN